MVEDEQSRKKDGRSFSISQNRSNAPVERKQQSAVTRGAVSKKNEPEWVPAR
jgi:hypothetical protein